MAPREFRGPLRPRGPRRHDVVEDRRREEVRALVGGRGRVARLDEDGGRRVLEPRGRPRALDEYECRRRRRRQRLGAPARVPDGSLSYVAARLRGTSGRQFISDVSTRRACCASATCRANFKRVDVFRSRSARPTSPRVHLRREFARATALSSWRRSTEYLRRAAELSARRRGRRRDSSRRHIRVAAAASPRVRRRTIRAATVTTASWRETRGRPARPPSPSPRAARARPSRSPRRSPPGTWVQVPAGFISSENDPRRGEFVGRRIRAADVRRLVEPADRVQRGDVYQHQKAVQ